MFGGCRGWWASDSGNIGAELTGGVSLEVSAAGGEALDGTYGVGTVFGVGVRGITVWRGAGGRPERKQDWVVLTWSWVEASAQCGIGDCGSLFKVEVELLSVEQSSGQRVVLGLLLIGDGGWETLGGGALDCSWTSAR
ncbi:hypothetical protein Tco_0038488 [Tanacetum coccineum]